MGLPIKDELAREEAIIERGMRSFVEVGNALMRIRDNDLYTATHNTFEAYCKERWGFARSYANKLIGSAKVAEVLGTIVPNPKEGQLRPLANLEPETITQVWQEAVETAPEGKITGKHLENVRKVHFGEIPSELEPFSDADNYVNLAILQLSKINLKDPKRKQSGVKVINWCIKNLCGGKYEKTR